MDVETAAKGLLELGNATRLRIFRLLVRSGPEPLSVGAIQSELAIPASTLSHHISRLVWAGLVEQERAGRTLRCRPCFTELNALVDFLYEECCQAPAGELPARRPSRRKRRKTS